MKKDLTIVRNEDIPLLAKRCLAEYGAMTEGTVDLLKIARNAGVKVIKNSVANDLKPKEYGSCYSDGKKYYIIYDDTLSLEEKRLTIAHEIGHFYLKFDKEIERFKAYIKELEDEHSRAMEYQAELFGRCLLGLPSKG